MFFVYDLETTKNNRAELYYDKKDYGVVPSRDELGKIPESIMKVKDPELREKKIKEWQEAKITKISNEIEEKKKADIDRAALKWWTARIVCIGVQPLDSAGNAHGMWTFHGDDEKKNICDFFDLILRFSDHEITLIGKNSDNFDMPMIIGRAMAHDIGLLDMFRVKHATDVEKFFGFSKSMGMHGRLNDYAWGLGVSSKSAKATDVFGWVDAGLWDKVTEYCANDVRITTELVRRYYKPYVSEKEKINV